jgi:uncharacterized protein YcbX
MSLKVTELYVYPIKSLGRIALKSAQLSDRGFEYDRFWMLVKPDGQAITQRENPKLALFKLSMTADSIFIKYEKAALEIPKISASTAESMTTILFGNEIMGVRENEAFSQWFSEQLGETVILVRKSLESPRPMKRHEASKVNFSDCCQYLILGEASLTNLNEKLERPISIHRFRPNIVFSGGMPHCEDDFKTIQIGKSTFEGTKPCGRCTITTIHQDTAEKGAEPLKTLATYRKAGKKVLFGQYLKLVSAENGRIAIGDEIRQD